MAHATSERRPSVQAKNTPPPSRIQNKQQQKIMAMVDGYHSSISIAAGLRNLLYLWTVPGAAMVILGVLGFALPDSGWLGASFAEIATSIRVAVFLLSFVTTITAIVWFVRTWTNVRRLGKRAKVGAFDLFKRHVGFLFCGLILVVAGTVTQRVALVVVGGFALWIGVSFMPFLILAAVRLFWRSGSPPIGLEEELPHYGIVWFSSWFLYSSFLGGAEVPGLSVTLASAIVIVQGFCCAVAAITGGRLVYEASCRQDQRLKAIINRLDIHEDDEREKTVTSSQIESAWENSEGLVSFN